MNTQLVFSRFERSTNSLWWHINEIHELRCWYSRWTIGLLFESMYIKVSMLKTDMPASGDWMFTNKFLELVGEKLKQRKVKYNGGSDNQ